jgi:hypothetical protein
MRKTTTGAVESPKQIKTKYNAIIKELLRQKDDVRDNTTIRIKDTEVYKKIQDIPKKDLALHINEYNPDSPAHFLITCRLSGDDPFKKDFNKCIELLYDVEFNMEAYRNIGYNDGLAVLTSILLRIAGFEKDADAAIQATYNAD